MWYIQVHIDLSLLHTYFKVTMLSDSYRSLIIWQSSYITIHVYTSIYILILSCWFGYIVTTTKCHTESNELNKKLWWLKSQRINPAVKIKQGTATKEITEQIYNKTKWCTIPLRAVTDIKTHYTYLCVTGHNIKFYCTLLC